VQLYYQGAGDHQPQWLTVYPVCIYYYRRGPYLCAYGEVPQPSAPQPNWRNYRLDRIVAIKAVDWQHPDVLPTLLKQHQTQTLPTPETIQIAMEEAWGFDYYQPSQLLLLRFDAAWDRRYIRDTIRHTTFRRISQAQVEHLMRQHLTPAQQQHLLERWRDRPSNVAYYQAQYRQNDPNVHQRLRAWRPHVEVILPWHLRQRMIQEIQQEWQFYGSPLADTEMRQ
jgi:CRISPR-associated protein (TIGR03985 family)